MSQNSDFKKPLEKDLKQSPLPPLPFAKQMQQEKDEREREKTLENINKKEGRLTIEEANLLLAEMKRKQEELKNRLEAMYEQRGVTPQYLKLYMSNPSNFTPEQWEEINKHQKALVDSLNLPSELQEKAGNLNAFQDSPAKERRKVGKGQRRNWLPMR